MKWNCRHNNSANLLIILFMCLLGLTPSLGRAASSFWQGPYTGINVGGAFSSQDISTQIGSVTNSSYFTSSSDINAVSNASSANQNRQSLITGIQAGHDWAWDQFTYGVAADYSLLPLSSSNRSSQLLSDNSTTYSVYTAMSTNWLFTLRGRFGYQTIFKNHPSLLYITGGMAMSQVNVNNSYSDNAALAGVGGQNNSQNEIGWTVGAGVEIASFGRTTVNLEYAYIHLPTVKTTSTISNSTAGFGIPAQSLSSPFTTSGDFHASLFRLGVNYRFEE